MVRTVDGVVRLSVVARPRAKREGFERTTEGALSVRVRAPPVEGAANERVIEVVAKALGLRKSAVTLLRGATSPHKELAIIGFTEEDVVARLHAVLPTDADALDASASSAQALRTPRGDASRASTLPRSRARGQ